MSHPTVVGKCWQCGQDLSEYDLGREARCPGCASAVHACKNCRFYQPGRANDCLEPVAEYVADKVRANFCDYFQPHAGAHQADATPAEQLRAAAEDLFRS